MPFVNYYFLFRFMRARRNERSERDQSVIPEQRSEKSENNDASMKTREKASIERRPGRDLSSGACERKDAC